MTRDTGISGTATGDKGLRLSAPAGFDSLVAWSRPPILDSILAHVRDHWEPNRRLLEWVAEWEIWSGRALPDQQTAASDFAASMLAETDLAPEQIAETIARLAPPPADRGLAGDGRDEWLEECSRQFLMRVRPWFPVWFGFTAWVDDWCRSHDVDTIVYLCRDSLPFYALAHALARGSTDGPDLVLVHLSRRTVSSGMIGDHLEMNLATASKVAFVDSGCYGSLVPKLLELRAARAEDPPPVFFYFSRNPLIFGYVNYLMAFETLKEGGPGPDQPERAADFTIFSGDVIEALPKPYRVQTLSEHGLPEVEPTDLLSFVLSGLLVRELNEFARGQRRNGIQQRARAAALDRYGCFAETGDPVARRENLLFDRCAPKSPPPADFLNLPPRGLPPQRDFFGLEAG
ncbi:MAG TPA: hypothetical protein VF587_07885 [Solirubrobacteraceae bacterium]